MQPYAVITQGDQLPALDVQLLDASGDPVDVSGADSVVFRVQLSDRSRQASVTTATIVNARGGFVRHQWLATETNLAGFLLVNVVVVTGGLAQTYPVGQYLVVQVLPRLAPP